MDFALDTQSGPKSYIRIDRDPHVYTMEFSVPLRFRPVTDGCPMRRKAGAKKMSQCGRELFRAGFYRDVAGGPGASSGGHLSDTKSACIGK
jgi:hypothetical protein